MTPAAPVWGSTKKGHFIQSLGSFLTGLGERDLSINCFLKFRRNQMLRDIKKIYYTFDIGCFVNFFTMVCK